MLDRARLDSIYQHILALAALSEDFRAHTLGPIHLLKYAYLADLAHAEHEGGSTFSGTDWRFHHFGPWSNDAFERVAPATNAVSAKEFRFASQYADDFVRYRLERQDAEEIAQRFERELPFFLTSAISRAVAEHGSDTADLLRHVYLTKPMLGARPGEYLDFSVVARERGGPTKTLAETPAITSREKRRRAAVVESARAEIRKRLAFANTQRLPPSPPPRYDAVFYEGTAALDRLAGEPIRPSTGQLEVGESMWESSLRREPEIP